MKLHCHDTIVKHSRYWPTMPSVLSLYTRQLDAGKRLPIYQVGLIDYKQVAKG